MQSDMLWEWQDEDGDRVVVDGCVETDDLLIMTSGPGCVLEREQINSLRAFLDAWPGKPVEDTEDDQYRWTTIDSVAVEAHEAVYGDRGRDYGHPRENFARIASIWTALLSGKLRDGECVTPADVGRCMIGLKIARDVYTPKRDNRVDIAGYAVTLDRLEAGR